MRCSEYEDLVAADADGVLGDSERERAQQHAEMCPPCGRLRRGQQEVSAAVRRLTAQVAPELLRRRVVRDTTGSRTTGRDTRVRTRLLVAGAVAAALILGIASTLRTAQPTVIATLVADVHSVSTDAPRLPMQTRDPQQLRHYYAGEGVAFAATVENLEPSGLQLVGGGVSSIGDTLTTRTVYRNDDDSHVVCRRFPAGELAWPDGGQPHGNSELFSRGGVHIALTRIGDVVCAMASAMPRDRFISAIHVAHR